MPITYPYIQYGGIWTTSQATDAVAAGTWAVPPSPHLLAWGQNSVGQLGLGNTTAYSSPKQVGSLTNWDVLDTNQGGTTLAVKTDGTLWSWGQNGRGQLGLGNTTNYSSPKQVGALTNWKSVSSGAGQASYAIKTDGTLWAWGSNVYGELGLGNTTYYSSPKQVGALTNWYQVSGGNVFVLAVKTDGTLWGWGYNGAYGQLGLNNTTYYSSPKQVGSDTNWAAVSASQAYGVSAVKTDGTLWSWGRGQLGFLGLGNTTNYSSPKQVGSLTNWKQSTASTLYMLAVKTDGTLWSWGWGANGQLGNGLYGPGTYVSSPTQVGAQTTWSVIASRSGTSSYALKTDGTLWSWGNGNLGALGLGNTTSYSSPKQVGSLTTWLKITAGSYSVLAIAKT